MEKPEVKAGPEALAEREKEESELMRIVSRVRREVRRVLDEIKGHVITPHPSHLTHTPYSRHRCAASWTGSSVT
jgi:hypothetical protein